MMQEEDNAVKQREVRDMGELKRCTLENNHNQILSLWMSSWDTEENGQDISDNTGKAEQTLEFIVGGIAIINQM